VPSNFAVHSDLLVHWTGKDIDKEVCSSAGELGGEIDRSDLVEPYLQRLTDILSYGLWMTNQYPDPPNPLRLEPSPGVCFTELKLSQSRSHAVKYGGLGIAVKRPFVFARNGRPVVYYGPAWDRDTFLSELVSSIPNKGLLQFLKPMDSQKGSRLTYDYYSESEWRIMAAAIQAGKGVLIDPENCDCSSTSNYISLIPLSERKRLKYLVPLDGWLAAIIYPNLETKRRAQAKGSKIRQLIEEVSRRGHANSVEPENYPVELDLDLCMNF
jgi:hypothetical protein